MSVVLHTGEQVLAAYDDRTNPHTRLGVAVRDAAGGRWTITVGGVVRYRRRRRAAARTLLDLARQRQTQRVLAASPSRRPAIGGGLLTIDPARAQAEGRLG